MTNFINSFFKSSPETININEIVQEKKPLVITVICPQCGKRTDLPVSKQGGTVLPVCSCQTEVDDRIKNALKLFGQETIQTLDKLKTQNQDTEQSIKALCDMLPLSCKASFSLDELKVIPDHIEFCGKLEHLYICRNLITQEWLILRQLGNFDLSGFKALPHLLKMKLEHRC